MLDSGWKGLCLAEKKGLQGGGHCGRQKRDGSECGNLRTKSGLGRVRFSQDKGGGEGA